jgi:uncharacterized alpha-E superfamily protein
MLARVVENVYWLSRYLERAENTARIIGVNTNLLLDLPGGIAPGWLPLVDISGNRAEFDALFKEKATRGEERDVVTFLIADKANPGSICSSLQYARENARTLREVLPNEAWEQLNEFFAEFTRDLQTGINKRTRFAFLHRVVMSLQTLAGVLDGTMNRNDAYTFSTLGRNLERADMTSRIVDVRSAQLLPAETPELRPFESVQWMSVLKSLSGYQMYRRAMRTPVRRPEVLKFLFKERLFPRAFYHTMMEVDSCLRVLPRRDMPITRLAALRSLVTAARPEAMSQEELHHLIDQLEQGLIAVNNAISDTYFLSALTAAADREVVQPETETE